MISFHTQIVPVGIPAGAVELPAVLELPPDPHGLVLFAHDSGSTRHSPRNQRVAEFLHDVGLATLLFDLHAIEEAPDAFNPHLRFDVELLARRLQSATRWARQHPDTAPLRHGYFGASSGGAAALLAAADEGSRISAVVTRGAGHALSPARLREIVAPTMLLAGGNDTAVARASLETWARLTCEKSIEIIPGAGRLFEEPGALDIAGSLAARWFGDHLRKDGLAA